MYDKSLNFITLLAEAEPLGFFAYSSVSIAKNANLIAIGLGSEKGTSIFNLTTGMTIQNLSQSSSTIAISPNGKLVANAESSGPGTVAELKKAHLNARKILIFDVATGQLKSTLTGHIGQINQLAFSEDGTHLYSAGHDKKIKAWSIDEVQNELKWELELQDVPWSVNADCDRLLYSTGNAVGEVHPTTGTNIGIIGPGFLPEFSEDCAQIGSVSENSVMLWSAIDGEVNMSIIPHGEQKVDGVIFFPDRSSIISFGRDGVARILPTEISEWLELTANASNDVLSYQKANISK